MRQIGDRFSAGADGIALCHGGKAETRDLRKDEPHPVAAFASLPEFGDDVAVNGPLGIDKALEIVRVGHGGAPFGGGDGRLPTAERLEAGWQGLILSPRIARSCLEYASLLVPHSIGNVGFPALELRLGFGLGVLDLRLGTWGLRLGWAWGLGLWGLDGFRGRGG